MITILAALSALQGTPAPAYWGDLTPGPHPVGFTQAWIVDSTRRLPQGEKYDLRFRPILMNIWYPAKAASGKPMSYANYFGGAVRATSPTPRLLPYAKALIDYQRGVAWSELGGTVRDSTEPALAARIDALMTGPTFARRDAPRGRLSEQVIVYTTGSGGSIDDNVVLCEYLASLGYTVLSSPFPMEDNSGFGTFVADRSRPRDIARMLAELPRRGFPVGHVTAVGHSAGAQAMQWYAADPSAVIDAVLSLDTTEDYSMLSDRTWAYYTTDLVANRSKVRVPFMFVADHSALFELADSLATTTRFLVTVPDIGHNDFISQGVIRKQLREGLTGDDTASRVLALTTYPRLVEYIGRWIGMVRSVGSSPPPAPVGPLRLQQLPPGEKFPELGQDPLTSARQVRHLFAIANAEEFARRALAARAADSAIVTPQVLMMLLVDGLRRGDSVRSRAAYRELLARDSSLGKITGQMESRARLFERIGAKELAEDWRKLRQSLIDSTGG